LDQSRIEFAGSIDRQFRFGLDPEQNRQATPWAEWHNLEVCYTGLGWEVQADFFIKNTQALVAGRDSQTQSELLLTKHDRSGFVIFAVVDRNGRELFPRWRDAIGNWSDLPNQFLKHAVTTLGFRLGPQLAAGGVQLPATTIQMLTESSEPMTSRQLEELRKLYDQVRDKLLKSQRWAPQTASD